MLTSRVINGGGHEFSNIDLIEFQIHVTDNTCKIGGLSELKTDFCSALDSFVLMIVISFAEFFVSCSKLARDGAAAAVTVVSWALLSSVVTVMPWMGVLLAAGKAEVGTGSIGGVPILTGTRIVGLLIQRPVSMQRTIS